MKVVPAAALATALAALLAGCGAGKEEAESTQRPTSAVSACTTAPALFANTVWASFEKACTLCHVPTGIASGSGLIFAPGAGMLANYNLLRDYSARSAELLLSKSIGEPNHGGGKPFTDRNSLEYRELARLVPEMAAQQCGSNTAATPVGSTPVAAGSFWKGVNFKGNDAVLAKAAVLFAGRNPTSEESGAVALGGEAALRSTIRGYMQGAAFERFLEDVGDSHFLTPGAIVRGTGGLNAADWPTAGAVLGANGVTQVDNATRNRFDMAVRREGVELMKYIVKNELPYTDMVQGNYTVSNGVMARFLGATVEGAFVNADDDTEWRKATLPSARLGGMREHAGVLSTQAWLSRFPTTDTNRNRHRVNKLMSQFLATDASSLAMRPVEGAGNFKVPTVENPNCAACHNTIDPIAAGFQNWDQTNRYLPVRTNNLDHALPQSYRSGNYPRDAMNMAFYRPGDNWFRDGKEPGFGTTPMPGGFTGNKTALQWMGQQVATDSRFALGAVHFWYEGVFGREPLKAPQDNAAPEYAVQLAAFNAQNEEMQSIAARFRDNQGRGAFNVKDLLTDLMLSKFSRASGVAPAEAARAGELRELGVTVMLSPSQLNRKLTGLVGQGYADFNNPYTGWALNYGDFDGVNRNTRSQSHTMMQTVTIDRMVAQRSCAFAQGDFAKPAATRLLFPLVTLTDTPATPAGQAAIAANVRYLHKHLWKEDVRESDPEMQRTLKLFNDTWADRATAPARPVNCAYTNANDPSYAGRAWATVLAYMLGDVKFLYE